MILRIALLILPSAFVCGFHITGRPPVGSVSDLRATWSNGQAVQDYQNFLASGKQEIDRTVDGPSVIVVADHADIPPLAKALLTMGNNNDLVITPGQELPANECPVYVTLPPSLIGDFLDNLSESFKSRPEDFVFFSGGLVWGNIEDVLKSRGYCRDTMTQVLISGMKIHAHGVEDVKTYLGTDANGEEKIAGECTACGKWAGSIAERLQTHNVFCRTDFYREWRRKMWERCVFDAVFHLVGAIRDAPTTLSAVSQYYQEEVSDLVWEISQKLRGWRAITLLFGFEERMFHVGEAASDQPCVLLPEMYPFIWGSPVFQESQTFVEYLNYAQQEKQMLPGIDLPQKNDADFISNMRQGNLRADGVV